MQSADDHTNCSLAKKEKQTFEIGARNGNDNTTTNNNNQIPITQKIWIYLLEDTHTHHQPQT